MVEKIKHDAFISIFKELDSDQDDVISADLINLEFVPLEILRILRPIFSELEEIDEGITGQEFVDACERLYEVSKFLNINTV